jgi:hypothetical protein
MIDSEIDHEFSMEVDDQKENVAPNDMDFSGGLDVQPIGDLFQLCKCSCGTRKLSVLVYTILCQVGVTGRESDAFFDRVGAYRARAAH